MYSLQFSIGSALGLLISTFSKWNSPAFPEPKHLMEIGERLTEFLSTEKPTTTSSGYKSPWQPMTLLSSA